MTNLLTNIMAVVCVILLLVISALTKRRKPDKVKFSILKETNMGLVYDAFLPDVVDKDVVSRTLKMVVDGAETTFSIAVGTKQFTLPAVKDGASVALSIQDKDDAGNLSDWSEATVFIAADTIVPATPGLVNVKIVAEVEDPVVEDVVETPVEPTIEVEPESPTNLADGVDIAKEEE